MNTTNALIVKAELANMGFLTKAQGSIVTVSLKRRLSVTEVQNAIEQAGLPELVCRWAGVNAVNVYCG